MKAKNPVLLLWVQGSYFLLTALWPLVHMPSFMVVSGPKKDIWLVETVALLLLAIGGTLLFSAWRREFFPALAVLAVGSSLGLTWIDIHYATRDRIWDVYLLDAAAEILLLGAWGIYLLKNKGAFYK
jgi:hypothetical protein